MKIAESLPHGWRDHLGGGRLTLGYDIATTEKKTSNPSSLALVEEAAGINIVRLALAWKSADPEVALGILNEVSDVGANRRISKLCVDATSERFFAARVKREFGSKMQVELIVSSENIVYLGESMNYKLYLGNLLVNTAEDGQLALPNAPWVRDMLRQVIRSKGTFECGIDANGNHGDLWDAIKLALHGQITTAERAEASAATTGSGQFSMNKVARVFKNPFAHLFAGGRNRQINP